MRTFSRRHQLVRLESSIAIAAKDRDVIGAVIGGSEVQYSVPIEVCGHNGMRGVTCGEVTELDKSATAMIEEHADRGTAPADDRQIGLTVAIEVCDRHFMRTSGAAVADHRRERSIPFVQQNADRLAALAGYDQIRLPVAIQVGIGNALRLAAY